MPYREIDQIPWVEHPTVPSIQIKPYITYKSDSLNVTFLLVRVPRGVDVPEHIHADQDDILSILGGRALMWVDGAGSFPLYSGILVRVPKGTRHSITEVEEDLIIHDVFCPALF